MDDSNDLGPLPIADENSVLQIESFKALEGALPAERFVLRPEPQPDAGVDWCVELRIDGCYTGMRAHIQVKAKKELKANSDGSVSYSADVSNLNYLLNGLRPLYVLYIAQTKELRYTWVRDEVNRIEKDNPDWQRQETVTLRLTKTLDEPGLQEIYDRIRQEARFDREIHDLLSRADVSEKTIHVNVKESKITDPDEIRDLLLEGGLTFISSGDTAGVLEAIDKLSHADKKLPRLLLIRAFAECSQGHYQMASGYVAEATVRASELSESDRMFLGLLRDICDYQAGRITRDEYIRRQKELSEKDESEFSLSRRIVYLWESLLEGGTRQGITTYLPSLRAVVGQVLALEGCSESLRIQARTALLYGEGIRFGQEFIHALATLKARTAMGRATDVNEVFSRINADLAQWTDKSNALVKDALEHGNAHLIGDACYTRSLIMFAHHSSAPTWLNPEAVSRHLEHAKAEMIPDLQRAVRCYQLSGHIEWELRAKTLLADFAALTGDAALAKQLAREVLPVAEAYQFDRIANEARDHLAGDPFFRQMQRKFLTRPYDDPDLREADFSDEDMGRYAEDMLESAGLPRDRLAVMTREVLSFRDIARERVNWCRHIQLIQNLGHTLDPLTFYAADPVRYCYCERYQVASKIGDSDWKIVIEAFKGTYCSGCSARSPKVEPRTNEER
jgi:Domain of unknown function (DUF4365)